MRKSLWRLPISITTFFRIRILRSKSDIDGSLLIIPIKVRVKDSRLKPLVSCIEYLKHIITNKLIISIQIKNYWIVTAVVMCGNVDILKSSSSYKILSIRVKIFVDIVEIKIFSVDLIATIIGNIIDKHNKVVRVILSKDRVEIVLYTEFGIIVITWNDNTHWYFCCEVTQLVNGINPLVFFHFHSFLLLL